MENPPKTKRPPSEYNLFMKKRMSERPKDKSAREWMKKIGMDWKASQGLKETGQVAKKTIPIDKQCKDAGYTKECSCKDDKMSSFKKATAKLDTEMEKKAMASKSKLTERLANRTKPASKSKKLKPTPMEPVDEITAMYGIEGIKK